jgi:hypothetical protein
MVEVRKHIILCQSKEDAQDQLMEWQKRMAGKVCDVNIHPVEPIKLPQGRERQPSFGRLKPMDTYQIIVEYEFKPASKTSRR